MELTLQSDEAELLKRILTNYLSDLRMEISNTENYQLRENLQRGETILKAIIEKLEHESSR